MVVQITEIHAVAFEFTLGNNASLDEMNSFSSADRVRNLKQYRMTVSGASTEQLLSSLDLILQRVGDAIEELRGRA